MALKSFLVSIAIVTLAPPFASSGGINLADDQALAHSNITSDFTEIKSIRGEILSNGTMVTSKSILEFEELTINGTAMSTVIAIVDGTEKHINPEELIVFAQEGRTTPYPGAPSGKSSDAGGKAKSRRMSGSFFAPIVNRFVELQPIQPRIRKEVRKLSPGRRRVKKRSWSKTRT